MRSVAARAGVSVATVSRVLSGSPRVKPETAAAVQRIIDELNFVPNASATTLKYGRSNTFGMIIPNATNPFFHEFIREFESLLTAQQQGVLLANADFPERVQSSIRRMLTSQVEGVIVIPSDEEFGPYNRLALKNIPTVTFDRRSVGPFVSDVSFRFDQGMFQAAQHLHQLGHKRIGFIGGSAGLSSSLLRLQAFTKALKKSGLKTNAKWICAGGYTFDSGAERMRELMTLKDRPTAVIAANDLMALGALRCAHDLRISVPRDVSLIGVDDIFLDQVVTPSITTIALSRQLAARACKEAFEHMAKNTDSIGLQYFVKTALVLRESTAPPPTRSGDR